MPELGTQPTNKYLPPRPRRDHAEATGAPDLLEHLDEEDQPGGFLGWVDRLLSR